MGNSKVIAVALAALILCACGREAADANVADQSAHSGVSAGSEVKVFGADLKFEKIKEKLRGNDAKQVADAIVQMVTMQQRTEVADLLQVAWNGERDKNPDLNWQVMQDPQVRLALAQVLGQWYPDNPQYRDHVLAAVEQAQGMEKIDALIALGAIATDSDIEYLERTGKEADEATAAGALAALQIAGGESATQALERIKNDPNLSTQRKKLATQLLGLPRPPRK
jgi:hypothetical protein